MPEAQRVVATNFDHWGTAMAYRDLLLHLDDSKGCAKRVDAAVRLAARHGAHLTGLYPIVEIPLLNYIKEQIPAEIRANIAAEERRAPIPHWRLSQSRGARRRRL